MTRDGFRRWNGPDLALAADWNPRHGEPHVYADGTYAVYISNNDTILRGNSSGVFTDTLIPCNASPHLADFASWGDDMYITCGAGLQSYSHDAATATPIPIVGNGSWNNDYTTPAGGYMPSADVCEAHAGYLFVASVNENYNGSRSTGLPVAPALVASELAG